MAWASSGRRQELPPNWPALRRAVLKRDKDRCQWKMGRTGICGATANQVDHVRRGPDHSQANLRALCADHHKEKSSSEGGAAYWAAIRESRSRFRGRQGNHPGLI